jgi:hypothetical protein
MWKRLSLAGTAAAVLALVTVDAFAFPISPVDVAQPSDQLIQVRQGCGLGRHRGAWGGCRWNGNPGPGRCWWRPTPWGPQRVCT